MLAEMGNIERSNIQYRLNSGRANYVAKGGKLGRKKGSVKTEEKKLEEYRDTIALLKKGYSIRNIAKLQGIGISTVQRIKNQFISHVIEGESVKPKRCLGCLKNCNPAEVPYCITEALIKAAKGEIGEALLFCGADVWKAEKIETVKEVIDSLLGDCV